MRQFIDKNVVYQGKTRDRLVNGAVYKSTHVYAGNIGVIVNTNINGQTIVSSHHTNFMIVEDTDKDLYVQSVLTLDGDPVGLRLVEFGQEFDLGVDDIKDLTTVDLVGFKTSSLIDNDGVLATTQEHETGLYVSDRSNDRKFCKLVRDLLIQ